MIKDLCKFDKKICVRARDTLALFGLLGLVGSTRIDFTSKYKDIFTPTFYNGDNSFSMLNIMFASRDFFNLATIRHHHSHHYYCHHHSHRHYCHHQGHPQDLAGTHLTQHRVAVFLRCVYLYKLLSKYKTVELGNQLTWPSIVFWDLSSATSWSSCAMRSIFLILDQKHGWNENKSNFVGVSYYELWLFVKSSAPAFCGCYPVSLPLPLKLVPINVVVPCCTHCQKYV